MIASFAAFQDWDAVFLFAYTHNNKYEKPKMESFFDIEGNPLKMPFMPLGARIFLGSAIQPLADIKLLKPQLNDMFKSGPSTHSDVFSFVRSQEITREDFLKSRFALAFDENNLPATTSGPRAAYTQDAYVVMDDRAIVFAGKATSVGIGKLSLDDVQSPFVSMILVSEDGKPITESQKLLLAIVGRGGNKDMAWDNKRKSVGDHWGNAPPQIEVIKGRLTLASSQNLKLYPLNSDGQRLEGLNKADKGGFILGTSPTLWYELSDK